MKLGTPLPSFNLPDQDWNEISSKDLIGKACVIYFYPKDDTLGCTKQACAFRDHFADFEERDVRVIGISSDSPEVHRGFIEKHGLPFTLLSDKDRVSQRDFGVGRNLLGLVPGRVTFIFDSLGKLVHSFSSQVNIDRHINESLRALDKIQ